MNTVLPTGVESKREDRREVASADEKTLKTAALAHSSLVMSVSLTKPSRMPSGIVSMLAIGGAKAARVFMKYIASSWVISTFREIERESETKQVERQKRERADKARRSQDRRISDLKRAILKAAQFRAFVQNQVVEQIREEESCLSDSESKI